MQNGTLEVKVGDKTLDLAKAFPLTIGDLRKMGAKGLVDKTTGTMNMAGPDTLHGVLLHVCQKVDAAVTEAGVDGIPVTFLPKLTEFFSRALRPESETLDRPTLTPSTS